MYIRFLCRFTFWRYILASDHFRQYENLAVLDKSNKRLFVNEGLVHFPDNRRMNAFLSGKLIAATKFPIRSFQLEAHYDKPNNRFKKTILSILPYPDINHLISKSDSGNNILKKDVANIFI